MRYVCRKFTASIVLLTLFISSNTFASNDKKNPPNNHHQEKIKELQDAISYKKQNASLDHFRLLDQDLLISSEDNLSLPIEKTIYKDVLKSSNEVIKDLLIEEDFIEHRQKLYNPNTLTYQIASDHKSFELLNAQNKLHRFYGDIQDIVIRKNLLAFIDNNGIDKKNGRQFIYFIDLNQFQTLLGNAPLPIFKIPIDIPGNRPATHFDYNSKDISIFSGNQRLLKAKAKNLRVITDPQMIVYNLTASLVDPETFEDSKVLTKDFLEKFIEYSDNAIKKNLKNENENQINLIKQMNNTLLNQIREKAKKEPKTLNLNKNSKKQIKKEIEKLAYADDLDDEQITKHLLMRAKKEAKKALKNGTNEELINNAMKTGIDIKNSEKKFITRFKILWAKLTLPSTNSSIKIRDALLLVAHSFTERDYYLKKRFLQKGIASLWNQRFINSMIKISGGVLVSTGILFPEALAEFMYQGISLPVSITEFVFKAPVEKIAEIGYHGIVTFDKILVGVFKISDAYLNPTSLKKLSIGLPFLFTIAGSTLGIPHLIVNTKKLVNDLKNDFSEIRKDKGFIQAFILRQQQEEKRYKDLLSQSEAKKHSSFKNASFSKSENREIKSIIKKEKDSLNKNLIGKASRLVKSVFNFATFNQFKLGEIKSLAGALRHFIFSFASFTNSGVTFVHLWNAWFFFRSFITYPRLSAALLINPNLYKITGKMGLSPTKFNGAKLSPIDLLKIKSFKKHFSDLQLKKFLSQENELLLIEKKIQKAVAIESFKKMISVIDNQKDFSVISQKDFVINSIENKKALNRLSFKSRSFFYAYYKELLDKSLISFYSEFIGKSKSKNFKMASLRTLKRIQNSKIPQINPTELVKKNTSEQILKNSIKKSKHLFLNKFKMVSSITDHVLTQELSKNNNNQLSRFFLVQEKIKNPAATARAVRSMIISNLIDKPIELLFIFIFAAGIQTSGSSNFDLLRPLQDSMFGPNSFFYLSRETFGPGFLYGVITGVYAQTWYKLQMDAMNEKNFGRPIPKRFKEKPFLSFLKYNALFNPKNSWWRNQIHNMKISWSSLRASTVTMLVTGLIFRGRFDLDIWNVGFLFVFFTPEKGIRQKIGQSFELTTDWYHRNFTRKMITHPDVQKHIGLMATRGRAIYNLFYKSYENIQESLLYFFKRGGNDVAGPMAMARALFGGNTPTEWASLGLNNLKESPIGKVPGVQKGCNGLLKLLTNNYTAWKK